MWVLIVMFGLAALSGALALWQWWLARGFSFAASAPSPGFAPSVSLLKPLSGVDELTEDCLRSWLVQEYPGPVEVLFGVSAPDDPAIALCNRLIAAHPNVDARVVVRLPGGGANAKAATLAHLESLARHDVLVVSDADVWVPPGLLASVLAPLSDPRVGLVNCFYRLAQPATPALRWEALAVNADFWSNVLQARALGPLDFALGAVMAMRRADLARAGGFASVVDYLADDYQIGQRLAALGGRIELSHKVVECREPARGWAGVWAHQLRWARTARTSRPVSYLLSILGNVTLWTLLAAVAVVMLRHELTAQARWAGLGLATVLLALRLLTAQANHRRLSPATALWRWSWMAWAKDLLQAALWFAAFTGNRIVWRDRAYRVGRDGRLQDER
jgi:ceramide glucosyltransferase